MTSHGFDAIISVERDHPIRMMFAYIGAHMHSHTVDLVGAGSGTP